MKIVNHTQFLALPAGTLFAKYYPEFLSSPMIKMESVMESGDFCCSAIDMPAGKLEDMEKGASSPMNYTTIWRDGCFNPGQLFAVYEQNDVYELIAHLQRFYPPRQ